MKVQFLFIAYAINKNDTFWSVTTKSSIFIYCLCDK